MIYALFSAASKETWGRMPERPVPPLSGGVVSVQAISWVFEHSKSRLGPRHVLLSIANHAKSDGTGAWPSVSTIAREAKLSIRQVQYALVTLSKLGELRVSRGKGPSGCNLYSLPLVQGLRTGTSNRGAVSGSTVTQKRVSKIAPEPKSLEPSLNQPKEGGSISMLTDEQKKRKEQRKTSEQIQRLERILREDDARGKTLVTVERARIELELADLKRKVA